MVGSQEFASNVDRVILLLQVSSLRDPKLEAIRSLIHQFFSHYELLWPPLQKHQFFLAGAYEASSFLGKRPLIHLNSIFFYFPDDPQLSVDEKSSIGIITTILILGACGAVLATYCVRQNRNGQGTF